MDVNWYDKKTRNETAIWMTWFLGNCFIVNLMWSWWIDSHDGVLWDQNLNKADLGVWKIKKFKNYEKIKKN